MTRRAMRSSAACNASARQPISEAAYKLGSYLDALYPEARWKATRGVGNLLRHQYDCISDREIWEGVVQTLPGIRDAALAEIARLEAIEAGIGKPADAGRP